MTIDWTKPLVFAGGSEAEIEVLATDMGGSMPVLIRYKVPGFNWTADLRCLDGRKNPGGITFSAYDIINAPARHEGWMNINLGSSGKTLLPSRIFDERKDADLSAQSSRIACIKVSFTEGEGL